MKKQTKTEIKEGCGEMIGEIVISLILIVIGGAVLALFGVDDDAEWLDSDLMMLIGIGAILIPAGIIFAIIHAIKKKKEKKIKKLKLYDPAENNENDFDETEIDGHYGV